MKLKIYQVDAFTDKLFAGNPAAVCPLENWLPDFTMQNIAMENNLAETAFIVKRADQYEIRWFTPLVEVDLCGHATLAAAFILFNGTEKENNEIVFFSARSGVLKVSNKDGLLCLDFPTDILEEVVVQPALYAGLNIAPQKIYKGKTDYLFVYATEADIVSLEPDFKTIGQLAVRGIIVTAKGDEVDFVSRFFAPQCGVDEDPVTGSAHTSLIPYWAMLLGKNHLVARQLSARGGALQCEFRGERVSIGGNAVLYLEGEILVS